MQIEIQKFYLFLIIKRNNRAAEELIFAIIEYANF